MAELVEGAAASHAGRPKMSARDGWRTRVEGWSTLHRFVVVLLALYIVKQGIFVVAFHPFSGHDEVAHYSYLQTVATEHRVPILLEDRLPENLYRYCRYVLNWDPCRPSDARSLSNPPNWATYGAAGAHQVGMQYAANHPPLYYLLMTPLYWISDSQSAVVQQYLLRVAAIPFGLLTVFLAFRTSRALFPGDAFLAVTVPAFVAFQPQVSYEAAMVNNDIIAIALYSWILYLLVTGIRDRFPRRTTVLIGFALGLALLSKGTSITVVPIIALAVFLGLGWRNVRGWLSTCVVITAIGGLMAFPWYLFLWRTYGNLDGFEQISKLQWWNYYHQAKPSFVDLLFNRKFVADRFAETWGQFGWRLIPLSSALLWAIAVPLVVGAGGLVQYALTARRGSNSGDRDPVMHPASWQVNALLVLLATAVLAYLAVVQFGTTFSLTQARYFFPAVNAGAILLLLGLRTVIPRSAHRYGQGAVFAALVLLNILIFTQFVIPHYRAT